VGRECRKKKHPKVSGCSVPDVTKQKSAFPDQITNDFVWKSQAGWESTHSP